MRTILSITIITLLTTLSSCSYYRQYKDSKAAGEVLAEVGATGGKIYFTTDDLTKNSNEKHFLELNIVGSSLFNEHKGEELEMASHIAVELYKRLDPKTIQENYGINIFYNGQRDILNYKKYFFKITELEGAARAFKNIDVYMDFIWQDNLKGSYECFDTTRYQEANYNVDSLNKAINKKTGKAVLSSFYCYMPFKLESASGKKPIDCFSITAIFTTTKRQVRADFLTDAYNDNKILAIDTRSYEDKLTTEEYIDNGGKKYLANDFQGAFKEFTSAIESNPGNALGYNNRGMTEIRLGDNKDAIDDFTKAIQIKPDYSIAYNNRGYVKASLKDYRGAIDDYDKAIEFNANYVEAYRFRGDAEIAVKQTDKGCLDFKKAFDLGDTTVQALIKKYCK